MKINETAWIVKKVRQSDFKNFDNFIKFPNENPNKNLIDIFEYQQS